jgi:putative CocE/NonD family hydrolase
MTTEVDGIAIEYNLPVRMRDGVTLRADVYRPVGAGRLPVLLLRIPYNKTVAQGYVYANPVWYARHGYVVVVQDTRGRYESEGEFAPLIAEAADGADTIAWCRDLPGTTGKVGTFGFSYSGVNQLLAASEQPAGLAAACPGFYPTSMYDHFSFVNGAFCLSTIAQWLTIIAPDFARRRNDADALSLIREAEAVVGKWHPASSVATVPLIAPNRLASFPQELLAHPARDGFWEGTDVERLPVMRDLPCLHVGGWYDTFIDQTLSGYKRMSASSSAEQRLLVGPWLHIPWSQTVGEIDFGHDAANVVDAHQLAFFDAHLKGGRRRNESLAPVSVFMMGSNRWRNLESWPPAGIGPTRLFLHSRGRANSATGDGWLDEAAPAEEPSDVFVYDPLMPVPSVGGHACCSPDVTPMGAYDQSTVQMRNDLLIYDTRPVDVRTEVLGAITIELWIATTVPDTDFTAKLCHLRRDGRSINLCEGIQRLRFARDPAREHLATPGEPQCLRFVIGNTAVELAPGEALRLEISSSNFPAFDRNPNTGGRIGHEGPFDCRQALQTVFHRPDRASSITLGMRRI